MLKLREMAIALLLASTPLSAQTGLLSASPIPQGAEMKFCYYAGLAYSQNAFVLLAGSNTVTTNTRIQEERLLQCTMGEDGVLTWTPQSTMQIGR